MRWRIFKKPEEPLRTGAQAFTLSPMIGERTGKSEITRAREAEAKAQEAEAKAKARARSKS